MRSSFFIGALLMLFSCAGNGIRDQKNWVENTLASMSLEQKVGQVMAPAFHPRFYNQADPQFRYLRTLVQDYHIGGMMFYRGMPYEVVRILQRLQNEATIPMMMMADAEWGVAMRVQHGTRFLQNMAVGATRSEDYAYTMGQITAEEARAVGLHVVFAPVLDVNNNPDNIIINTRSFGEDPKLVARLGAAFIRGLQEHGVYATAKHFPGHGDTADDSHLNLPVISAQRERLQSVELPPFKAAVDAGVNCVMVAHITYSDVPEMQGRPATLDPYFINEVLREEMGFDGLVLTDAMDMGGITENYWSGQAAVMAINSGVDVLLIPPDFAATFEFVVEAVKEGRIPMQRLEQSVRRILRAKHTLGLHTKPAFNMELAEQVLADPEHQQQASKIANDAMTLLRDDKHAIPLHAESLDSVLVVTITDEENRGPSETLNQQIKARIPIVRTAYVDPRSTPADLDSVMALTDSAQAVIIGAFVKWGSSKGSVTLPDTTAQLLSSLFEIGKPMAVISFGSPYVLRQLPDTPSYLCAYDASALAVRAAARAIFGETAITARLPVSIPGHYAIGHGLQREARRMQLSRQIDDARFQKAYAVLQQAIADSVFPGAQVAIVHDGNLVASRGFGHQTYDPRSAEVDTETIYDLASVTKVAATTLSAMMLWEQGKLLLDVPVKSYLPEFSGGLKDSVTVRHLLTHSSGTHWWTDLWNKAANKSAALDYIYTLPLDFTPGDSMVYSDLGLIMVGEILRTVSGKRIDHLARQLIFQPMGLKNTLYTPPPELLPRIAPTEIGGSMDRGLIHGEVHDENTFFLDGVSSHAGLFSTAEDLAELAQMLLNGGIYRHHRFFTPQTIHTWKQRQNMPEGSIRALGWVTPADEGSSAGDYFSDATFGHTGFTGTSMWIDPENRIAVILLTNRVHPTRERGGIYEVRRAFHNTVLQALTDIQEPVDSQTPPDKHD